MSGNQVSRFVAYTALCRALLLGRLALTLAAVGVSIGLVADVRRTSAALILIAAATGGQVAVLTRWPAVIRWRLCVLVVDAALMIGVLVLSRGGVAYFCYAAGWAALSGALLGVRAMPLWLADAVLGLTVATELLRTGGADAAGSAVAPLVLAFPMVDIACGVGAAAMTTAIERYIDVSIAAQRAAAASERARVARELHDSVGKTLRGVSFAAVALPSLLRHQPALAEQLAATVSEGAAAAVREAREVLAGLRRDVPDQPFPDNIERICRAWSDAAGIHVRMVNVAVEPPLTARYELIQILNEALHNVARHANATLVEVYLRRTDGHLELTVRDNGSGFRMAGALTELSTAGRFGIVGMAERAQTIGGTLRVDSAEGAGTTVTARIPMSSAAGLAANLPPSAVNR
ncbi:sensor histidine kinase [Dactylosporangium sp. CA-233914]|uniref:sensor histidine kinase n=1 Tax=Dactylosporangium sp. CA-233914 TaxID=3239934 RepID=UPI003D8FD414